MSQNGGLCVKRTFELVKKLKLEAIHTETMAPFSEI